MTKEYANEIRKAIRSSGNWSSYFSSKENELGVCILEWYDDTKIDIEKEKRDRFARVMNAVSNSGMRPNFRTETERYSGFINCFYIVFTD